MSEEPRQQLRGLSKRNIYLSLLIGLAVSGFLIYRTFDMDAFTAIQWTSRLGWLLVLALALLVIRHFMYMYRVWVVTGKQLSFRQAFESIVIWEFASVATPGIVGGAAVAMFILNRERISMGKSTASVMIITLMDNIFFISASLVMYFVVGLEQMFALSDACEKELPMLSTFGGLQYIFFIGLTFSGIITFLLAYGAILNPVGMKSLLIRFTRLPFLRKFRDKAEETGDDIITTAHETRGKSFVYWAKVFGSTVFAWTCKYAIVNVLLTAFGTLTGNDQLVVMSRMLALWLVMLIPITPGASGLAEITFIALMCAYIPTGLAGALTLLWRFLTYYPYLLIGVAILPGWLNRVAGKKRERWWQKRRRKRQERQAARNGDQP